MQIINNAPLRDYTTIKLGGLAQYLADFRSVDELREILALSRKHDLPVFIIGSGSNTIARDEGFGGIVARNQILGFEILSNSSGVVRIKVAGGENWDRTVARTVEQGWSGIEALSAIPGTVGAAPVQNIGAYGQEIADALHEVEVLDLKTGDLATLSNDACNFSYRSSIFRTDMSGRYCILSVTMLLSTEPPSPPFYAAVEKYFEENNITEYTPKTLRDAVMNIRLNKLPDPTIYPNAGSFFKNAVIDDWLYQELIQKYPDMPSYNMPDNRYKVPSGWLIEQAGLKGSVIHGIRIHDKNALVLINESADSYQDLSQAREAIKDAVRDQFRIELEQEPLEI